MSKRRYQYLPSLWPAYSYRETIGNILSGKTSLSGKLGYRVNGYQAIRLPGHKEKYSMTITFPDRNDFLIGFHCQIGTVS